jgi:hypothetical protein
MKKAQTTKDFDLSKTNWEIDPDNPNLLRQKLPTKKSAGKGVAVIGIGGCINWKNFKGKTDQEKQQNAIAMASLIDEIA